MNPKPLILGTIVYTVCTFVLAVLWHVVIFGAQYKAFGYIEGEPNFFLGLVTIFIQGAILSFLFPYVKFSGSVIAQGLKYAFIIGVFFWTSHVLAFVAKQQIDGLMLFISMESFYLLLQFGIYGLLIGKICQKYGK